MQLYVYFCRFPDDALYIRVLVRTPLTLEGRSWCSTMRSIQVAVLTQVLPSVLKSALTHEI